MLTDLYDLYSFSNSSNKRKNMYASNTGDMGCEMGVPDFRHEGLVKLLPEWGRQPAMQLDVDDAGQAGDDLDGDS